MSSVISVMVFHRVGSMLSAAVLYLFFRVGQFVEEVVHAGVACVFEDGGCDLCPTGY